MAEEAELNLKMELAAKYRQECIIMEVCATNVEEDDMPGGWG